MLTSINAAELGTSFGTDQDLEGLSLRDLRKAGLALDEPNQRDEWWADAPSPAWEAFIITCIARGKSSPGEIFRLARTIGGREAASSAA